MVKALITTDFKANDEKHTLFGILYDYEPTLLSCRFTSKEYPEIEGVVYEYFYTSEYTALAVKGYDVPLGTFFGTIAILKGWDIIKSGVSISFTLEPNTEEPKLFEPNRELKPGEIFVAFRRMNKPHELSSFYVDVRGGSTDGAGRNEHGEPHFHLLKKNTREEIAKINIPFIEKWNASNDRIQLIQLESGFISKSEKKELVEWLEKSNNLLRLLDEWTESNKYNNRVLGIQL